MREGELPLCCMGGGALTLTGSGEGSLDSGGEWCGDDGVGGGDT